LSDGINKVKKQLFRVIFWQLMMIMGLALILFLLQGMHKAFSSLAGGMAYWLPTVFFLWRVSKHTGARAASRFVMAFFSGEVIKLILSAALFVLIIKFLPVNLLYVLAGFMFAILAFWIVSISSVWNEGVRS
jgi:ATP synthase protein I